MRKYVLDTNLYVRAFRSREGAAALQEYLASFTPSTYLSSVVLHELLVGASTPTKARDIQRFIADPLVRVGRFVTPSHAAWEAAGEGIAAMARRERRALRHVPKSLVTDYLLAASCREAGVTLLTENTVDFEEISRYLTVSFEAPWPAP